MSDVRKARQVRDIVVNLHHAYIRPEFRDRHYASFHTGPSATADIEGVLIHGAQGVRSLSVLPLARGTGNPTTETGKEVKWAIICKAKH
jgi:hypothetical protein